VQRKLHAVTTSWYNLGLELGLKVPILDLIDTKYHGDPSQCFRDILKEWLRGIDPLPTWELVVIALKSPTVGEHQLAEEIEIQHLSLTSSRPPPPVAPVHPQPSGLYDTIYFINLSGSEWRPSEFSRLEWSTGPLDWTMDPPKLHALKCLVHCKDVYKKACMQLLPSLLKCPSSSSQRLKHSSLCDLCFNNSWSWQLISAQNNCHLLHSGANLGSHSDLIALN